MSSENKTLTFTNEELNSLAVALNEYVTLIKVISKLDASWTEEGLKDLSKVVKKITDKDLKDDNE